MSDGHTHTKINLAGTVLAALSCYFLSELSTETIATGAAGAVTGTIFLSPDLDLKQSNSNRAWGGLGWLWFGYHRLFRHRKLSHFILLGTLSRLIYLGAVSAAMVFIWHLASSLLLQPGLQGLLMAQEKTGHLIREGTVWLHEHQYPAFAFFTGLAFSDALHLGADLWSSFLKKSRRSRRGKKAWR